MHKEKGLDHFHDSELGDVYDLYNACNGAMSEGLLDARRLDALTAGEREALDVERLREVWRHTASGCETCAQVVYTLNAARGMLRGKPGGSPLIEPRPSIREVPARAKKKAAGQDG